MIVLNNIFFVVQIYGFYCMFQKKSPLFCYFKAKSDDFVKKRGVLLMKFGVYSLSFLCINDIRDCERHRLPHKFRSIEREGG